MAQASAVRRGKATSSRKSSKGRVSRAASKVRVTIKEIFPGREIWTFRGCVAREDLAALSAFTRSSKCKSSQRKAVAGVVEDLVTTILPQTDTDGGDHLKFFGITEIRVSKDRTEVDIAVQEPASQGVLGKLASRTLVFRGHQFQPTVAVLFVRNKTTVLCRKEYGFDRGWTPALHMVVPRPGERLDETIAAAFENIRKWVAQSGRAHQKLAPKPQVCCRLGGRSSAMIDGGTDVIAVQIPPNVALEGFTELTLEGYDAMRSQGTEICPLFHIAMERSRALEILG